MEELEVIITLSNGDKFTVNKNTVIFPIKLIEDNGEEFSSQAKPVVLEKNLDIHDGYIPVLTSTFAKSEFFYIDGEGYEYTVYQSSSIVSLKQRKRTESRISILD
ncbi:hypothetical protein [Halobacillus sp. Cin3]|uniref:hypothetical protein n=1 Tax=Halobacillus sp. Cin3 TaxID=2928441 RepID=UPI00248ECFFA|nr:hypothetical protein [Halobacillus sp. Cin3]